MHESTELISQSKQRLFSDRITEDYKRESEYEEFVKTNH